MPTSAAFLSQHTIADLPACRQPKQAIVDVDAEFKVAVAFDLMKKHNLLALPVYGLSVERDDAPSPPRKHYVGILTVRAPPFAPR
jgi:CBS domain-containing protein